MRIDHHNLKALFQGYVASRKPPSRKKCPAPGVLIQAFEPAASTRVKKRIADHIAECSFCREEFMVLFGSRKSETKSSQVKNPAAPYIARLGTAGTRGPGRPAFWQYAFALLGLSLAVSSFLFLVHQKELSETRQPPGTGITLVYPRSGQALSVPFSFRWQGKLATEYYILELFDESLMPVWTSEKILDVQVLIPSDIASRLIPGRTYFWMVTSVSPNSPQQESKLSRFAILPPKIRSPD